MGPSSYFLGYSDDTRALLAHLAAEAPWRLGNVRVLERDPALVRTLRATGISAAAVDLWDDAALRAEGLEDATMVVVFAERLGGPLDLFEQLLRTVCPAAQRCVITGSAPAAPARPSWASSGALAGSRLRARAVFRGVARFFDELAGAC